MTDATYNLNGGFKPTAKRFADLAGPDYFPTPAWATYALIDNEKFEGDIWEPACGDGSMSRVLETTGLPVRSTDLFDRGYGEAGVDFLTADSSADDVITQPALIRRRGDLGVASSLISCCWTCSAHHRLARSPEGAEPRPLLIFIRDPPSRVWVFSERITFYPSGVEPKGSGTTAYAWFVWDRATEERTELKWLKPGYKARYRGERPAA